MGQSNQLCGSPINCGTIQSTVWQSYQLRGSPINCVEIQSDTWHTHQLCSCPINSNAIQSNVGQFHQMCATQSTHRDGIAITDLIKQGFSFTKTKHQDIWQFQSFKSYFFRNVMETNLELLYPEKASYVFPSSSLLP